MAVSDTSEDEVIDLEEATSPSPKFVRLTTLEDVRVEMARVYRDMRSKRIKTDEGTRLVYVLSQLGRVCEVVRIENRVEEMRRALERAGITHV